MRIILMRHGDASAGMDDASRPLSAEGRLEAGRAGLFLKRIGEFPDAIYHSTLLRSRQTAEGVAGVLGMRERLYECKGLCPCDSPRDFASDFTGDLETDVMVVGHQPFLSELASYLLTRSPDALSVRFTTGTMMGLERAAPGHVWTLRFHMTARAIARALCGDK